jgi:hypothetical protein
VDVSNSVLLSGADHLRDELRRSVMALKPSQEFHIILAQPGGSLREFGAGRLVPAIARYKAEAIEFIAHLEPRDKVGSADPVVAFQRAFDVKPELIYLVGDGEYENVRQELFQKLRAWNSDRAVKITTIGP